MFLKKKKKTGGCKKDITDGWNKSFNKRFCVLQNQLCLWERNQSTIEWSPLTQVESNKFNNVYSKIFVWSNYLKIGHALKKSIKILNRHIRIFQENKITNEWSWSFFNKA